MGHLSIRDFISPASFWTPDVVTESGWLEHAPCAFWLVDALRPPTFVELGSHTGFSYLCLCQAVARLGVPSRGFAVEPSPGGEAEVARLTTYHDPRYGAFSRLVREPFDEAAANFEDGSIDLLHVDRPHGYMALRHLYDMWRPKLSPRCVILLHGTAIRMAGIGVHQLWAELCAEHPGFEFRHGQGLGVIGVGGEAPTSVKRLLEAARSPGLAADIGAAYARLGGSIRLAFEREREVAALDAELTAHATELAIRATRETEAVTRAKQLETQLSRLLSSTSWRITTPVRQLGELARSAGPEVRRRVPRAWQRLPGASREPRAGPGDGPTSPRPAGRPRVVFLSGEPLTPGHRYRVVNVASALPPQFFETAVIGIRDVRKRVAEIAGADVLWVWRARDSDDLRAALDAARSDGARVVYDIDDLIFLPELARTKVIDGLRTQRFPGRAARRRSRDIQTGLLEADWITMPTEPLARQIRLLQKSTTVVPNGFDGAFLRAARNARRKHLSAWKADVIRIGYASGTLTHQRDLAVAAPALARVLAERRNVRFVTYHGGIDLAEFPELRAFSAQIELRRLVTPEQLPGEYASFDVNIAPLEVGNPFCEAKSELKYFEAALAGTVTVASPTEPFAAVISHGRTGFLATDERAWYEALSLLIDDPATRERASNAAYRDVLWRFGPERRSLLVSGFVGRLLASPSDSTTDGATEPQAGKSGPVELSDYDVLFESPQVGESRIAVILSTCNDAHAVLGTLESVRRQTIRAMDLIVIDDGSTDGSEHIALRWMETHGSRFTRAALLRNRVRSGRARSRNAGIEFADTELFVPLDPNSTLLPTCLESGLALLDGTGAAAAFAGVELFGYAEAPAVRACDSAHSHGANQVEIPLIRRACWLTAGGYPPADPGSDDFDLWRRFIQRGFFGVRSEEVTARSRVGSTAVGVVTAEASGIVRQMLDVRPWLDLPPERIEGLV